MRRSDPQAVIRTAGSVAARRAINIIGIISTRQCRGILLATTSLLLSFALAFSAFASSTKYPLSYSGRLVDDQGAPLSGPVDFAVQFYRQAQDGAGVLPQPLSLPGVELNFGVFQVELSLSEGEIGTLFGDASLEVWIEASKKDADGQYRPLPRQRFSYVPYAMHALSAATVPVDDTTIGFDTGTGKLKLLTSAWGSPGAGKYLTTDGSGSLIWSAPAGSGDMLKSTYDSNADGKVDGAADADKLGGQAASYYTNASNLTGTVAYGRLPVGTAANTVAAGDDARFSNARAPSGVAGGDLNGSYPNPSLKSSATLDADRAVGTDHIKDSAITSVKLAVDAVDSSKILNQTIATADIADNAVTDAKLAGITMAGKVSGNAITSGTLGGTTQFSGSGGVNTTGPIATTSSPISGYGNFVVKASSTATTELKFNARNNSNYTSFKSPETVNGDMTYTLPPSGPAADGQVLSSTTSGVLSWLSLPSLGNLLPSQAGNSGKVLQTDGSAVSWVAIPSAPVTSVAGKTGAVTLAAGDITSGSFDSSRIADDAVTSAKIANGAIATEDIANAAITDAKLAGITTAGKVANSATTATNLNTASAIVARDASGNFSAGTITANLNGNATTSTTATTAGSFTGSLSGDVSGTQSGTSVTGLQGRSVASTAPSTGQALAWNGSAWTPQTLGGSTPGGSTPIVSKSTNYTITTSDSGTFFLVTGAGTTLTLPAASTVSSGFSVTVKVASGYTIVALTGSDLLDGVNQSKTLGSQAVAQFISNGSAWYVGMTYGQLMSDTPVACASNNCYTTTAAISAGQAVTATGKLLTLQNGVWVQFDGNNVLRVDGTDNWQLALSSNGRSYSANNLNKISANLAGRVCPTNVYVDNTNMVAQNRCLYFDGGNYAQRLDHPNADGVTDQSTANAYRLGIWNTSAGGNGTSGGWYEGNIQTCAGKGMRLPVLYETAASDPGGSYKPTDASPTFSGMLTGVPSAGGWTWTASAYTAGSTRYWVWSGTSTSNGNYAGNSAVRCVVQ